MKDGRFFLSIDTPTIDIKTFQYHTPHMFKWIAKDVTNLLQLKKRTKRQDSHAHFPTVAAILFDFSVNPSILMEEDPFYKVVYCCENDTFYCCCAFLPSDIYEIRHTNLFVETKQNLYEPLPLCTNYGYKQSESKIQMSTNYLGLKKNGIYKIDRGMCRVNFNKDVFDKNYDIPRESFPGTPKHIVCFITGDLAKLKSIHYDMRRLDIFVLGFNQMRKLDSTFLAVNHFFHTFKGTVSWMADTSHMTEMLSALNNLDHFITIPAFVMVWDRVQSDVKRPVDVFEVDDESWYDVIKVKVN